MNIINFDIKPMSQYKKGTNQYSHKRKGFLDMKPGTWISVIIFVLAMIIVALLGKYLQGVHNKFSMLEHQSYSIFTYKKPEPTPIPTKKDIILAAKHADIIYRIWGNETTYGTNATNDPTALHMYCSKRGQTNEFGFDPQDKLCFTTFAESVARVDKWFDTVLKTHSLAEALKLYSGNSKLYVDSFINQ